VKEKIQMIKKKLMTRLYVTIALQLWS